MRTKKTLYLLVAVLVLALTTNIACSNNDTPPDATTDSTAETSTETAEDTTSDTATDTTSTDSSTTETTTETEQSEEVVMPLITAGAAPSPTLCQGEEIVYFSCDIQDTEAIMSLCGSPDFDGQNGFMEFRLPVEEMPAAVIYRYPEGENTPFRYAQESVNQSISFGTDTTTYELAITAEDSTYSEFNLTSNEGSLYHCGDNVVNQLSELSALLPTVPWSGTPIRDQVAAASPLSTTAVTTTTSATGSSDTYTVKAGDTVFTIAQALGVDWQTIVADNNLQPPYTIYVNQQLLVPGAGEVTTYTVAAGDSLTTIGEQFGLSWLDLAQVNGISWPYWVYPGQKLIIPGQ